MARVPTSTSLGTVTPTVGPTVFQGEAPAGAFGVQIGQAVSGLGQTIGQVGDVAHRIAITQQLQDNERENRQKKIDFRTGLSNIQNEYFELQGEDAVRQLVEFQERIAQLKAEVAGTSSNDKVAAIFGFDSAEIELPTLNRLKGREIQQRQVAEDAVSIAEMNEADDAAINNFDDINEVKRAIDRKRNAAFEKSERAGEANSVNLSKGQEAASTTALKAVLSAIASGDLSTATDLFGDLALADEGETAILEGEDRIKAQRAISTASGTKSTGLIALGRDILSSLKRGDNVISVDQTEEMINQLVSDGTGPAIDLARDLTREVVAQKSNEIVFSSTSMDVQEVEASRLRADKSLISLQESRNKQVFLEEVARGVQERKDDNLITTYARRTGTVPPPIAFGNLDSLTDRRAYSELASQLLGESVSPLSKTERQDLEDIISGAEDPEGNIASTEEAVVVMNNIHTAFGSKIAGAVTAKMSAENSGYALAMRVAADNPRVAANIVKGLRLRRDPALKTLIPSSDEQLDAFMSALSGSESTPSAFRSTVLSAAIGHYLSRPEITGISDFDSELFQSSIEAVVGGVVSHEGNSIPTFAPGVDQNRFDWVVDHVTSDMIPDGAFILDGEGRLVEYNIEQLDSWNVPFTNDPQLKPSDFLGRYNIVLGDGTFILNSRGENLTINLRDIDKQIPEDLLSVPSQQGTEARGERRKQIFETKGEIPFVEPTVLELDFLSDNIAGSNVLNNEMAVLFGNPQKQNTILNLIKANENPLRVGRSAEGIWKSHDDPKGLSTIGFGHLLTKEEKKTGMVEIAGVLKDWRNDGLTDSDVDSLLQQDVVKHGEIARQSVNNWDNLNHVRRSIVLEMSFGLGENKLKKFHNSRGTGTLDFIEKHQWQAAADALEANTNLFSSNRRKKMADALRTGVF